MTSEEEFQRMDGVIDDLEKANSCILEIYLSAQNTLKEIIKLNSLGKTKEIADIIDKELNS
jgi:hypothetical protein